MAMLGWQLGRICGFPQGESEMLLETIETIVFRVGFAEVERSRRFVEHVLLIPVTEGFRKGVFGQKLSLSARVAVDVGFPTATVGFWQHLVS